MSAAVTSDWETGEVAVPTILRHGAPAPTSAAAPHVDEEEDVDAAATAFGSLRLVAQQPSELGTVSSDLFQRSPSQSQSQPQSQQGQQPSPQHAQYDPNATYPQTVSPATATAAVARFGQLDPVLLAGLENARERMSLLKFEDQIVRFIKHPREMQLSFPPLSSYHRLIVHRLADRCCLEHQTADFNAFSHGGYDSNSARVVTLFKTPQTIVPRVLLIDLSADMQAPTVTPASAPKIMLRKRGAPRGAGNGGRGADGGDAKNQQRTIEDRERAYAEARARIFGEDASSTTDSSSSPSSTGTTTSVTAPTTASTPAPASNGSGTRFGGNAQAAGPDGSRGFAQGGRGNSTSATQHRPQRDASPSSGSGTMNNGRGNTNGHANGNTTNVRTRGGDTGRIQQPQNWNESKVLWRNREQELNDPDFTRNHDAYRPARDSHFGGGGGRFGSQQPYYYDGPRSFGYQGAGQPGYPGRGRGPAPIEYSRIDPMHRHQGPPPPPPPAEYYRHHPHQQHQPPPPPPGAYHSSYSPHGRNGGYGGGAPPLPPPSSHQQHPIRRGSAGGSYHDDFPPLGK